MKILRSSLLREIRRFGADRSLMIITVIIPVLLTVIYVFMFAKGTIHNLPVAVVDADQSPTSRQVTRMISSTPSALVTAQATSMEQAREMLLKGRVDGIVFIPQGLESNIFGGTQAQIAVLINGALITNGSLLKRDITTILQAMNIGVETQMLGSKGIPASQGYQMAYPIALEKHILFNPYGSYAYYLLPALLSLLLIMMVAVTTVYVIGSEFRYSTAPEWLSVAGGSVTTAIIGKLSPYFLIFSILSLFMNTLLYRFLGLPFNATSIVLTIAGNLFVILAYMGVGILLVAITANMRLSLSLAGAYTVAAFSFAGLTFPLVAMYKPIFALTHLFPFTYYVDLFVEQSMRGAAPPRSLGDLAAMGVFILLGAAFLPMLKRKACNPKYFGKL